jgi:MFS superfamily sulfate permease-like transporter
VWVFAFGVTVGAGITLGIACSFILSIGILIKQTAKPKFAVLGRLPNNPTMYKNVKRFPTARQIEGVSIVRMEDRLFFANISFFRRRVARLVRHAKRADKQLGAIVVDASSMNGIDATSMQVGVQCVCWYVGVHKHAGGITGGVTGGEMCIRWRCPYTH